MITPRRYPFRFRSGESDTCHHAIIGMAKVLDDYPLYFDAVNEFGLAMAGLNFEGNAQYAKPNSALHCLASFELIPYLLGKCRSLEEARRLLESICVTNLCFLPNLPATPLHWLLADRYGSAVLEVTANGLQCYNNPVDVLTNNPPFPTQLQSLTRLRGLSAEESRDCLTKGLLPNADSRGTGGIGLPGDLTSASRFARCAFVLQNALRPLSDQAAVRQVFHVLGSVEQVEGCVRSNGGMPRTVYSACCGMDSCIYYYRTYGADAATGVRLFAEDLNSAYLINYPLRQEEPIPLETSRRGF